MKQLDSKSADIYIIIFSTTIFFLILAGFVVYFIIIYQKRQVKNKQEKETLQANFRQEMLKARIEVQEEAFTYVSREIHDNVTQVLSFVKLNLAMMANSDEGQRVRINENRELIASVITDLRDLSKSLSFEHITNSGLVKTIDKEVQRINKSGVIDTELLVEGEVYSLGEQRELVLFRIFQEALNNIIKHSGAAHFKITLQYIPEMFNLTLYDDGKGFSTDVADNKNGSGLRNMENRAALIGAVAKISSSEGKGCQIKITLNPIEQRLYI
ncbi:sensor histidine kinase [Mucilaginibacter sp.]|uniref:sensor histidine kinase n=1 Tax=Mucilaginibacter sp. TaxID=1882438 RepID=UPI003D0A4700